MADMKRVIAWKKLERGLTVEKLIHLWKEESGTGKLDIPWLVYDLIENHPEMIMVSESVVGHGQEVTLTQEGDPNQKKIVVQTGDPDQAEYYENVLWLVGLSKKGDIGAMDGIKGMRLNLWKLLQAIEKEQVPIPRFLWSPLDESFLGESLNNQSGSEQKSDSLSPSIGVASEKDSEASGLDAIAVSKKKKDDVSLIPGGILRLPDVMKFTGLSRSTIWRQTKTGTFPKSVSLGGKIQGWRSDEIETWIRTRSSKDYEQAS